MKTVVKEHIKRLDHGFKPFSYKEFRKYSADDRRRIIAIDALLLLKKKKFYAAHSYLRFDTFDIEPNKQVTSTILSERPCYACAKGALFIGHVIARNNCKVSEFDDCEGKVSSGERLKNIFSFDELELIEDFYECHHHENYSQDIYLFHKLIQDDTERLTAILENIIEHGHFQPKEMLKRLKKLKKVTAQ